MVAEIDRLAMRSVEDAIERIRGFLLEVGDPNRTQPNQRAKGALSAKPDSRLGPERPSTIAEETCDSEDLENGRRFRNRRANGMEK